MQEEQSVFGPYDDGSGGEPVYGDPMEIYRELQKGTGGQLRRVVRDARRKGPLEAEGDDEETAQRKAVERAQADVIAFPAIERLVGAARAAFRLASFDHKTGKGATERHCHAVLNRFWEFLVEEKKAPAPG